MSTLKDRVAAVAASREAAPAARPKSRRFANRRASSMPAQIRFAGMMDGLSCIIRDMSTTGAAIELKSSGPGVSTAEDLPRVFSLVILSDRTAFECEVVRAKGKMVGVKFIRSARTVPKPAPKPVKPAKEGFLPLWRR